jgi:lipoyl(octanoyl) transferase
MVNLFKFVLLFVCSIICKCEAWILSHYNRATSSSSSSRRIATQLKIGPQQLGEFEVLAFDSTIRSNRNVALVDYSNHPSPIPFTTAWDWQKHLLEGHVERMTRDANDDDDNNSSQFLQSPDRTRGVDTIIMLQHDPVYTLGTGSDEKFIRGINKEVPVIRMDRGGEVTYHGPGQLTVYPVLDLRGYRQDIHWYMRALEEAILIALSKVGLDRAERQDDVTGVWVDNFKVAACGVKVKRWVTMHGLAVNVETSSLENFEGIVPCGLDGRSVACINQFIDEPISVAEFAKVLKEALENVFEIQLISIDHEPTKMQ